jgi:hypothetical protein
VSSNCLSYLAVYDSLQLIKAILAFKGVFLSPFEQAFPPRACTPARRCTHVSFGMWLHSYLSAEAAVVR